MNPRGVTTVNNFIDNPKLTPSGRMFKGKISLGKEVFYEWVYVQLYKKRPLKGSAGYSAATVRCVGNPTKCLMLMIMGMKRGLS
jgi:hypothetical protein